MNITKENIGEDWLNYRNSIYDTSFITKRLVPTTISYESIPELTQTSFLPFYYFLSKNIKISSIVEFGSFYGLKTFSLFLNKQPIQNYQLFDSQENQISIKTAKKNHYQFKIPNYNVTRHSKDSEFKVLFKPDFIIFNDESYLDNRQVLSSIFSSIDDKFYFLFDIDNISSDCKSYLINFFKGKKLNGVEFKNKNNSLFYSSELI